MLHKHGHTPRKARIDGTGALHYIICRGIDRRQIFADNQDQQNFIERLDEIVTESKSFLLWLDSQSEISYHNHIDLQKGE
jgi:hypothetical protein